MGIKRVRTGLVEVENDRGDVFVYMPQAGELILKSERWKDGKQPEEFAHYILEAGDAAAKAAGLPTPGPDDK